jgi:hypothetical protein
LPELRKMLLHTWQAGWEARWALSCSDWLKPLLRTINTALSQVLLKKCGVKAMNNPFRGFLKARTYHFSHPFLLNVQNSNEFPHDIFSNFYAKLRKQDFIQFLSVSDPDPH